MLTTAIFYVLSFVCILAALMTVTLSNPVSCALSLILCLACLAGLYAQLAAGYVAVLQILIYAGAIMVLFLFVVMLLNLSDEEAAEGRYDVIRGLKGLICFAFLVDLYVLVEVSLGGRIYGCPAPGLGSLEAIGELLFTRYMVSFEVISLLLTAAVVGVVLITRKGPASALAAGRGGSS